LKSDTLRILVDQDYHKISKRINRFITNYISKSHAKGIVIGLSGGLDSSVVLKLAVNALGSAKVLALVMPSEATPKRDTDHAIKLAQALKVKHHIIDISSIIEKYTESLPADKRARGNLIARTRMNLLYYYAGINDYIVLGTSDKSEWNIGYFCYDEKTRAVTKDGFKTYDQLTPGDTIFSLDMKTGQVQERPVAQVFIFDHIGKMIRLSSRTCDMLITPNHRMLVHMRKGDGNGVGRMKFRTIEECLRRKLLIFPVPKPWNGGFYNPPDTYRIEFHQKYRTRIIDVHINHLLYLFGLFIGDGCCYQGKVTVPTKTMLNKSSYMSTVQRDSNGRFVKLLTQEHINDCQKTYDTYEVFFALPEGSKNTARTNLTSILESYQIDFSTTKNVIRISSPEIHSLFTQCGTYAKNKRIPKWILQYSANELIWLYKGLKDSDGNHSDRSDVYYTVSPQLAVDYIELCVKLGKLGTLRLRPKRESKILPQNKIIISSSCFEISTTSKVQSRTFKSRNAKWADYKGKIWCPDIPETHNLLVERNGKLAFCGNSKFGDGAADILPIADLYKTQVRAFAKHLQIPAAIIKKKSSPRLWNNHLAEEEIGMNYETIDQILYLLVDRKLGPKLAAKKLGISLKQVDKIKEMMDNSLHKRSLPEIARI